MHAHHAEGTNLEPILPVLARVFDRALEGGGAKNINFQELAGDLAQVCMFCVCI
jgi:aarF domain-containing kinase